GVREALACLPCKNDLYLLSTLDQSMLEETLDRLGLRGSFKEVRGSAPDKVAAMPEILRAHGLVRDETVAVGDTPHDIEAARAAGIEALAAGYGYSDADDL